MKHKKRKGLIFLALLLGAALLLFGCGGGTEEETETEAPAGEETADGESEEPIVEEVSGTDEEDSEADEGESEAAEEERVSRDVDMESLFGGVEPPDNFTYEMTLRGEGEMESYSTRIWVMGDRMRTEGEMQGETFISIIDEEYMYFLDSESMTAMRFPINHNAGMGDELEEDSRIDEFIGEEDWDRLNFIEEETINGVETYVVLDQYEEIEFKMWIDQQYGIPIRVQSSGPDPEDNYLMEVTNLEVGTVTEEIFEVPEDYEVMDFGGGQ